MPVSSGNEIRISATPERKCLLVIKADPSIHEEEISSVSSAAVTYGYDIVVIDRTRGEKVPTVHERCFAAIYLAGHGSERGFGAKHTHRLWSEVADELCRSACLQAGATLYLACCRGGHIDVARDIFAACGQIGNVIGIKAECSLHFLVIGFQTLLLSTEVLGEPLQKACYRMQQATDVAFVVHSASEHLILTVEPGRLPSISSLYP